MYNKSGGKVRLTFKLEQDQLWIGTKGNAGLVLLCREAEGRVPTRTGKRPGKMGRHFPVRKKSGNFEQTGKVMESHTKYWKIPGILDKYYLIFLVIFK